MARAVPALVAALAAAHPCLASTADAARARRAAVAWAAAHAGRMGAPPASAAGREWTRRDASGRALYHVTEFRGGGFVVVAADDRIGPVVAFSGAGTVNPGEDDPLGALLDRDLGARMADLVAGDGGAHHAGPAAAAARSRGRWSRLLGEGTPDGGEGAEDGAGAIGDVRVPPLVFTRWGQRTVGGVAVYNYYTPPGAAGAAGNYYSGCVATALAQVLRHHRFPSWGVGAAKHTIRVSGVSRKEALMGGDGAGGPYEWDLMPDGPLGTSPVAERMAVGRIMHDAGVSVGMDYGPTASSANTLDTGPALTNVFGFAGMARAYNGGANIPAATVRAALDASMDAGLPAILGIERTGGSHAVVCDGYGYSGGAAYHHINLGWGGTDDAWYALPTIDAIAAGRTYTSVYKIVYNAHPALAGQIVSGRVTDSATGAPIAGARVTGAGRSSSTGPTGIFALAGVAPGSTCSVEVAAGGYAAGAKTVVVGASADKTTACGNRPGQDLALASAGTLRFSSWPAEIPEGSAGVPVAVERAGPASGPAAVLVGTAGSGAVHGADFTLSAARLSWADGETGPKHVFVAVADDAESEGQETIVLSLEGAEYAAPGAPSSISVVIPASGGTPFQDWAASSGLSGASAAPGADPDGDRRTNLEEYAFGGDPSDPSSAGMPPRPRLASGALQIEFRRRLGATDTIYVPEFSGDLVHWRGPGAPPEILGSDGQWETVRFTDPGGAAGEGGRFARIRITLSGD